MATWNEGQARQEAAADLAEAIVKGLEITEPPVNPFDVIASERRRLVAIGDDFGDAFDGRLEYQSPGFLLFYNTKYGAPGSSSHHPRVVFTVAHELGHFFIDRHHQYLKRSGKSHGSRTEFVSDNLSEREADAFAAGLLMPRFLIAREVNKGELSIARLEAIADIFGTSLLSTAIRSVRLSDFPCAVAGIRAGRIAWMFPSEQLIKGGCYPGKNVLESSFAQERWGAFADGDEKRATKDGKARHWFQLFDREDELFNVYVTEQYLPVRVMNTLVVLLTLDEDDLFGGDEEEESGLDDD